eukprot:TRINITY_DN1735_c2_g1_i1.p1 TRINITY_DN1735_c2_g1~~TRINITY_DN1735_c2_g1_i1.p1  ORF type:complete len:370 (+),score=55.69 TRINITY_DN1735_c2_g1_i1:57-1112(+)
MPEGFLVNVVHHLPAKYAAWDEIAGKIPELNKYRSVRKAVDSLPTIDPGDELTEGEWRRCYLILSFLVQSYANNDLVPWDLIGGTKGKVLDVASRPVIPRCLSVPFQKVCAHVGLPMVITASGPDIWNCYQKDGSTHLDLSLTATGAEAGFHTVPFLMHTKAAPYLSNLFDTSTALTKKHLTDLLPLFRYFKKTFTEETKRLIDPVIFYDVYRPLLTGFYPDTVMFEGVGEVAAKGPSAGQSAMFFIFDSLLGIKHNIMTREFQQDMLSYVPKEQRLVVSKLMSDFNKTNLKTLFHTAPEYADVVTAYADFRRSHFTVASYFLKAASTGTGASSFRDLLADAIDGTQKAKL